MKRNSYRFLLGIGIAALLLAFFWVMAGAADAEVDGMEFDLAPDGQSMRLVGYSGSATELVIPETVQGLPVTELWWTPFVSTNPSAVAITSITIPKTVNKLYVENFYYHSLNLESVAVAPENETYSSLDGVLYNKDMTTLLYYPHKRKNTEYRMPDSVTSASLIANAETMEHLIVGKGMTDGGYSTLPKSLRKITLQESGFLPKLSFNNPVSGLLATLTQLTEIVVHPDNPNYSLHEGVLYNKAQTTMIRCLPTKAGVYTLPASVKQISRNGFFNCALLTEVILPQGLTEIQDYAFEGTGITRMTIPDNVTNIPLRGSNSIFKNCKQLQTLHIGSGLPNWNASASGVSPSSNERAMLEGCTALREITVAAGNTALCAIDNVLYSKDRRTILRYPSAAPQSSCVLPEEFLCFGTLAFESCVNLTDIYFPQRDFRFDHNPIVDCDFTVHGYWHTNIRGYAERFGYGFVSIDPLPHVTKVTISPATAKILAGGDIYFDAAVEGENLNANQTITFKVDRSYVSGKWNCSLRIDGPTRCQLRTTEWMLPEVLTVTASVYSPRNDVTVEATAQVTVENFFPDKYWSLPTMTFYRQNTSPRAYSYYDENGELLTTRVLTNWDQFTPYAYEDKITWKSGNPNLLQIDEHSGRITIGKGWPRIGTTYVTARVNDEIMLAFKVRVTWSLWLWPVVILLFGWLYL